MGLPEMETAALTESSGDPVVTKYLFFGGKRVAMDREGVIQHIVHSAKKEKHPERSSLGGGLQQVQ